VQSRFHRPDLARLLDPIVTAGDDALRFECLSSCASAHARVDLFADAFADVRMWRRGTTNVDLGSSLVSQLALLDTRAASLEVGADAVVVETAQNRVIERRVDVPKRWLRALMNVPALVCGTELVLELDTIPARALLGALGSASGGVSFVVADPRRPKVVPHRPAQAHIEIAGAQRLVVLRRAVSLVRGLRIYAGPDGTTVIVAMLPAATITIGLRRAVAHGFSGEGEALRSVDGAMENLGAAEALIDALDELSAGDLADAPGVGDATGLVDRLAAGGRLGYDRERDRYYRRRLPFVEGTPKRLVGAFEIVRADGVEVESVEGRGARWRATGFARGVSAEYRVLVEVRGGRIADATCTCRWMVRQGLVRGPCKHVLALRFAAQGRVDEHG